MIIHLRAQDIIDPETEAHYGFKTIRPLENSNGRISTTLHDHDFYELFLITYGRIWHQINHTEILLSTGTLVFIRPADCHFYRQYDEDDCRLINLAFPVQTVTALFAYLGDGFEPHRLLAPSLPPSVQLNDTERQVTVAQLTKLHSIPHTDKRRIRTQLRLLLANLLGRYFGKEHDMPSANAHNWLQKLCSQMQEPANLRGGVPKMQAIAHTSPEHLSRTFRKEFGCTPTQYINNLRLTYAANLLVHTDHSIIEISHEIGINNLSYFYRLFKQKYKITPAQFRAQNRKWPIP